jgi:predicted SAM-dependent methyltransferase
LRRPSSLRWRAVEHADPTSPSAIAAGRIRRGYGRLSAPLLRREVDHCWPSAADGYRMHLGCGDTHLDGWVNVDNRRAPAVDVRWDLRRGIPLRGESVALYYSEHVIEHMSLAEGKALFKDCHRTLKPGGTIRIAMPDLATAVENYRTGNWRTIPALADPSMAFIDTSAKYINVAFRGWGHRFLYDYEELERSLRAVGFRTVTRCERSESSIDELANLERRAESRLIVEASP